MAKPEYYYGVHSVESLLELEPERVLTLFTLKGRDDQRLQKILELAEPFGISVQKASRDSLEKLAGLPFHQGVVAAVRPHPTLNEKDLDALLQTDSKPLLLALDQVTDPHNLGACIRTAAAMGVTAVIVPRDRSASLTPTARKVAAGGAEKVKFIQVTNLARTLAHLKQEFNVRVVGTMLVVALVLLAAATKTRLNRAVVSVRLNLPVQAVVVMVSSAMPQVAKTAAMAHLPVATVARVLVVSRRLVAVRALRVAVASRVKMKCVPGAGCAG